MSTWLGSRIQCSNTSLDVSVKAPHGCAEIPWFLKFFSTACAGSGAACLSAVLENRRPSSVSLPPSLSPFNFLNIWILLCFCTLKLIASSLNTLVFSYYIFSL